jgi:hypothetical protein
MAPGSLHTIAKAERNVYCLFSFYLISVSFSYFVFKTIEQITIGKKTTYKFDVQKSTNSQEQNVP